MIILFKKIEEAYKLVKDNVMKRVDGESFKVYRVGRIIRVDIDA